MPTTVVLGNLSQKRLFQPLLVKKEGTAFKIPCNSHSMRHLIRSIRSAKILHVCKFMKCESDYIPESISSWTAYLAYFVSHDPYTIFCNFPSALILLRNLNHKSLTAIKYCRIIPLETCKIRVLLLERNHMRGNCPQSLMCYKVNRKYTMHLLHLRSGAAWTLTCISMI